MPLSQALLNRLQDLLLRKINEAATSAGHLDTFITNPLYVWTDLAKDHLALINNLGK